MGLLEPIALGDILAIADLQTRKDRKYLVPHEQVGQLLDGLPGLRALTIDGVQDFRYESRYFDTDDLASYLGAARRRPHRFKVRTRTYLDTSTSLLEVKVRDARGRTVKHRHPHDISRREQITPEGRRFVAGIEPAGAVVEDLRPALTTTYRRMTIVLGDGEARVTVDTDLSWHAPGGESTHLPGVALVETKTPGPPSGVDRALWAGGARPTTISKYCTGLAALRPELPANKWHRVLRAHFDRRGAAASMDESDVDHIVDQITDRIVRRHQLDLSREVIRDEARAQLEHLARRATVRDHLAILAERATVAHLLAAERG